MSKQLCGGKPGLPNKVYAEECHAKGPVQCSTNSTLDHTTNGLVWFRLRRCPGCIDCVRCGNVLGCDCEAKPKPESSEEQTEIACDTEGYPQESITLLKRLLNIPGNEPYVYDKQHLKVIDAALREAGDKWRHGIDSAVLEMRQAEIRAEKAEAEVERLRTADLKDFRFGIVAGIVFSIMAAWLFA